MQIDLYAAMTVDGRIAQHDYHGNDWTSPEDNAFLRTALAEYDIIVVGFRTFQVASKVLSQYPCLVMSKEDIPGIESDHTQYLNYKKDDVVQRLQSQDIKKVAVLGGTFVYSHFLKQTLFDNLFLTIEPMLWGSGLPLCDFEQVSEHALTFVEAKTLNTHGSLLLHYSS